MPLALPEKRALVLKLKDPKQVMSVVPNYQIIHEAGIDYIAVPHTTDVWHVLSNMGIKVNGYEPMRYQYNYPKLFGMYNPMAHQSETAVFCTTNKRCFVFNEMRTGKSAATLWAADYLKKVKQVKQVLILCTISCMDRVWKQAIFGLFPQHTVGILHGSAKQREQMLNEGYDFLILNHDGLKVGYGDKVSTGFHLRLMQMVKSKKIGLIIMDEGSEFRNGSTDKYAALKKITDHIERIWWLTGTPTPGGPEDAWAQCRIVNPSRVPAYQGAWKAKVMHKINQFKWVPNHGHEAKVFDAMQPAIRFKKSEVLDMMPVVYGDRAAELTKEQAAAYQKIKAEGTIKAHSGEAISAVNAAVLLGKMLQIAAGIVKSDQGEAIAYVPTNRLKVLDELIEQANAKVIVFAPYRAVVDMLVTHVKKRWTVDFIDGRITGNKRSAVIHAFQDGKDPQVLVAHPKTTGHGLELSAADTVIWFAPMHSVDLYEQANNRIMSGMQKRSMGIYHIGCTSLEWKIYRALTAGVKMQDEILKLYDEEVLGKGLTGELTSVIL